MLQLRYIFRGEFDEGEIVQKFEISNATALDFDAMENKIYWINKLGKVKNFILILS